MKRIIVLDGKPVEYEFIEKRIKNVNLRVSSNGKVSVSVPFGYPVSEAERFLVIKSGFILKGLEKSENASVIKDGGRTHVFGEEYPVKTVCYKRNDCIVADGVFFVLTANGDVEKAYKNFLIKESKKLFPLLVEKFYPLFINAGYVIPYPEISYAKMT
ncbi:MAG: M48 family metallopeptidase, partial [Clostridia bacterium]|nr:M48 family metallopeptidase [Clostridia bacterium]